MLFALGLVVGPEAPTYYSAICIAYGTGVIAVSGVWFLFLRQKAPTAISACSFCRASYCGVSPHLDATFTTGSAVPR